MKARSAGALAIPFVRLPRPSLVGRVARFLRRMPDPIYCLSPQPMNRQGVCTLRRHHNGLHSRLTVRPIVPGGPPQTVRVWWE